MKLALKELRYNKKKYILIEVIILLLMFMVLFLSGLVNGLGRAVTSSIELMNGTYFVISDSAEDIITVSNINAEVYEQVANELAGEVTTLDIQRMYLQKVGEEEKINVTYFAIEPGSFIEPELMEGISLAEADVENPIILDDDYMLEGIELSDTVIDSSTSIEFTVVGFSKNQMYGHTSVAFISTDSYTSIRENLNPHYEVSYHALVTNDEGIHDLDLEGVVIDDKQTVIENIPSYSAEHTTITMVVWLLVIISSVIIGVFYYIMTIQKEKQFAVMKSIGISMRQISIMIVCQVCFVACIGALLANILNTSMSFALPQTMPYYLEFTDALGVSAAFIVISVFSSLLSIIKVSKVDPMMVIGGEQ